MAIGGYIWWFDQIEVGIYLFAISPSPFARIEWFTRPPRKRSMFGWYGWNADTGFIYFALMEGDVIVRQFGIIFIPHCQAKGAIKIASKRELTLEENIACIYSIQTVNTTAYCQPPRTSSSVNVQEWSKWRMGVRFTNTVQKER